ncbi:hypothetical protein RFI_29314 [Reticulomyxa filosa]|uniref:Uncharacterized protein n=1 Tax=Reticulomyxa filosa TaxID=46433 RepID=X6M4W0_RETFI|nr:hypothetical protein RFI_29314 [Reticulomyxa filosa]|eukprot:ETO08075.1 hypothetical protein RFI_29314 [Reticulomyxa filosa]
MDEDMEISDSEKMEGVPAVPGLDDPKGNEEEAEGKQQVKEEEQQEKEKQKKQSDDENNKESRLDGPDEDGWDGPDEDGWDDPDEDDWDNPDGQYDYYPFPPLAPRSPKDKPVVTQHTPSEGEPDSGPEGSFNDKLSRAQPQRSWMCGKCKKYIGKEKVFTPKKKKKTCT